MLGSLRVGSTADLAAGAGACARAGLPASPACCWPPSARSDRARPRRSPARCAPPSARCWSPAGSDSTVLGSLLHLLSVSSACATSRGRCAAPRPRLDVLRPTVDGAPRCSVSWPRSSPTSAASACSRPSSCSPPTQRSRGRVAALAARVRRDRPAAALKRARLDPRRAAARAAARNASTRGESSSRRLAVSSGERCGERIATNSTPSRLRLRTEAGSTEMPRSAETSPSTAWMLVASWAIVPVPDCSWRIARTWS